MPATLSSSYGELVTVSDVFIDGSRYLKPKVRGAAPKKAEEPIQVPFNANDLQIALKAHRALASKKGSSKLTENQAKLCVPIGHFLSSPILIEAASRALAHLWHGMLDSADDHVILDLLEQGIIVPVFILASGRETLRVPLSHWTPEKLKRVIPVLRQATELVQPHERKYERTIGPLPLFIVFAVDAETALPVLEVFCRLFGSDMAASERGYKDFGDFLQRAVTTFLQDGGKIQEDPRYQLLRSAGPKRTKQKDDGHICPEPRIECRTRKQALCLECRDWAPPCFSCGHITCLACLSKEVEKAAGADGEQATPFPICEYCGGSGCATACGEERIGSRMSKDDRGWLD
jgi:hypothetical protein